MAELGQNFDPSAAPPRDRDFDTIPAGQYEAQVVESEVVPTKSGSGMMLKLTWEVITGPFTNRKVFQQINFSNQSAKAQEIGQRELADICEAAGVGPMRDSEVLHFKPLLIRVGIEKQEGYEDKNVVKRVKPMGGNAPAASGGQRQATPPAQSRPSQQQPNQAPPPQQRPAAAGSRPWNSR